MLSFIKNLVYEMVGRCIRILYKLLFIKSNGNGKIIIFNTAMGTENMGDFIIMHYCNLILQEMFGDREFIDISTHMVPTAADETIIKKSEYRFVCGTNLLTSHIEKWWNWRLPDGFIRKQNYKHAILLGAGWEGYQSECSQYTKMIYRSMLDSRVLHSVRDQYTADKLKVAGINNVLNTGCPTMWKLTPEFCRDIPCRKADNVVTTITDYRRDWKADNIMLEILGKNYRYVYLWLQGKADEEYLETLQKPFNLKIIPRDLNAYRSILNQGNIDYVGTRLHAGIFALNHHVRSLIIAVDNRAIEISRDTNLPVIARNELEDSLEMRIMEEWETSIQINQENIRLFKSQFK